LSRGKFSAKVFFAASYCPMIIEHKTRESVCVRERERERERGKEGGGERDKR